MDMARCSTTLHTQSTVKRHFTHGAFNSSHMLQPENTSHLTENRPIVLVVTLARNQRIKPRKQLKRESLVGGKDDLFSRD